MSEAIFHSGELSIQERLGVKDQMAAFAQRVVRPFMPDQHREFYQQLPYLFCAHQDKDGQMWASILWQETGFIESPSETRLHIRGGQVYSDFFFNDLEPGQALGILGIDLSNRRRNRLSASVAYSDGKLLELEVRQSFGNCPQYIQTRDFSQLQNGPGRTKIETEKLSPEMLSIINRSDTFFVASNSGTENGQASDGADISHRGGKPGFVYVENSQSLLIPDFPGNFHFNTLGNFLNSPSAGLLFLDFEYGHLLQLTGEAEIVWHHELLAHFDNAERFWRFKLSKARLLPKRLAGLRHIADYSPNSLLSGDWETAKQRLANSKRANKWFPMLIKTTEMESDIAKSLYLDGQVDSFIPGQHINVSLQKPDSKNKSVRSYSVSGSSADGDLRITVKRDGELSTQIHQALKAGDTIWVQQARGNFTFDSQSKKPALLIAAGIGITPIVAMAERLIKDAIRHRYARPCHIVAIAKSREEASFFDLLNDMAHYSQGRLNISWHFTQATATSSAKNILTGRPNRSFYSNLISSWIGDITPGSELDLEAYLCGPNAFMQETYEYLMDLGFSDEHIHGETFGPSQLIRQNQINLLQLPENQIVEIELADHLRHELNWFPKDGSLLDSFLQHGLEIDFSCRSGRCGSCRCRLKGGEVQYQNAPEYPLADNEILPCIAYPVDGQPLQLVKD
ncbi:pyridoxamine 5'-phosphate oxidase family protein [uncultured Pseudoteredinibacter sp.]|uniref:2Fe-2S iron-sulfur cluster-binding protein n=1 Tax=uncultured Pseudoteredinibacter sp. TaxID=1641701 RepID=UPI002623A62E|nr:pyridoxamine 5'-phosphate oxidase family protein [uncultured Pseudoteredinibacter sp.]